MRKDRFRYTMEALFITILLSLPLPLGVALLGLPLVLYSGSSLFLEGIGIGFYFCARWLFMFEFIRQLCREEGLASTHFLWRPSAIDALRRYAPLLYLQMPFTFIYIILWLEGEDVNSGILGRASFIVSGFLFIYALINILSIRKGLLQRNESDPKKWFLTWNKWLFVVTMAGPCWMVLLSIRGYSFSAMEMMLLMYRTITWGFMVYVLDQVINRWFAVVERKFAYNRAIAKRDALKKAREEEQQKPSGEDMPEIEFNLPKLDVATISEQNRALLKVLSFSLFLIGTYWLWQDFFQAVQSFQSIELWKFSVHGTAGLEEKAVTLATLLVTVFLMVLTYAGVKNLPGLIEVMVLQRFNLDNGIRFAVTTTARYLVMIVGVIAVSKMIGLEWNKLGWLVAALGVGLGFGLQEIVANFVSGLIILYERPIRIGDTVTINDLSGRVSEIRMRATTIIDWDLKELIIPNKTFVTSQFINWTLSDSTTRVVIKVGVAYGSDTILVAKSLKEVAKSHESVLEDPEPAAYFLGFGASSLDFELRVYVSDFGQRLMVTHDLHTEINQRFNQLGVEIAFPQMDLHVRDTSKPPKNGDEDET